MLFFIFSGEGFFKKRTKFHLTGNILKKVATHGPFFAVLEAKSYFFSVSAFLFLKPIFIFPFYFVYLLHPFNIKLCWKPTTFQAQLKGKSIWNGTAGGALLQRESETFLLERGGGGRGGGEGSFTNV